MKSAQQICADCHIFSNLKLLFAFHRISIERARSTIIAEKEVHYVGTDSADPKSIIFSDGFALKRWRRGRVSIIVGNVSTNGYVNGVGTDARLTRVTSKAELRDSVWLLADLYNHCIRMLHVRNQTISDYLGVCEERVNPPRLRPPGLSYPYGLILNRFNRTLVYLSQEQKIWRIDTNSSEILTIYEDARKLTYIRFYSQMVWHKNWLIVTYRDSILRLDLPRRRTYPKEIFYTVTDKIEWTVIAAYPREEPLNLPRFRAITSCGLEGVFIAADFAHNTVKLLDFNTKSISTVCEENPTNSSYNCSISSPYAVFCSTELAKLYIGHESGLTLQRGESSRAAQLPILNTKHFGCQIEQTI